MSGPLTFNYKFLKSVFFTNLVVYTYINNYFNVKVCLSIRASIQILAPSFEGKSPNVSNKSYFILDCTQGDPKGSTSNFITSKNFQ